MFTEKHFQINEKSSQRGIPDSNRSNFLLIMIEIPDLWHFKANAVLFSSMIKISIGGSHGPPGPPLDPPLMSLQCSRQQVLLTLKQEAVNKVGMKCQFYYNNQGYFLKKIMNQFMWS